jgi:hypothetical protein
MKKNKELEEQPGRGWANAGGKNRRHTTLTARIKRDKTQIGNAIKIEFAVRNAKAAARNFKADDTNVRERSTGNEVIFCPVCQCPVVDSRTGRERHAQIRPACREAIGR